MFILTYVHVLSTYLSCVFSILNLVTSSVALAISFQGSPGLGLTTNAEGGNKPMSGPESCKATV